jgi:hypothetical protein
MDDKSKRGPQDATRVNVNETYELQYWSERFNVTPDKLREAVVEVGPIAAAVEQYLKKR